MAASSSNANKIERHAPEWDLLQSHLPIERVDWDKVRLYLCERFTSPPRSFVNAQGNTFVSNVEHHQVCDHILHLRPCPSFTDPNDLVIGTAPSSCCMARALSCGHQEPGHAIPTSAKPIYAVTKHARM